MQILEYTRSNARNFQRMQVSCNYHAGYITPRYIKRTWQTLDSVLYYVCPAWLKQIPLNKFWKKLKKTLDKYSEFGILIMWVRERREILLCQWRHWTSHRLAFCKSAYTKAWGVTDKTQKTWQVHQNLIYFRCEGERGSEIPDQQTSPASNLSARVCDLLSPTKQGERPEGVV